MNTEPKRRRPLRRLSKALFAVLGSVAILLAVGLGVFRLLVAQIPGYQIELRDWVAAELGLTVEFAVVDARLGFRGPELTLRQATIGSGRDFFEAERATITLDPVALIFSRQIDILRLTLDGVRLTVERDAGGTFRLGDFALTPDAGGDWASIPESVEVAIRDSELIYIDSMREQEWHFDDLDLVIASADGAYLATASLNPPESLAERLALEFELRLSPDGQEAVVMRLAGAADSLDLETLAELIPLESIPSVSGLAAIDAEVEWTEAQLTAARFDLDGSALDPGSGSAPFDRLSFSGDWQQLDVDAWRLRLDRINVLRDGRSWDPSGSMSLVAESDSDGVRALSVEADFVRMEDLEPLVAVLPDNPLAGQWSRFQPRGDVSELALEIDRRNESFDYELESRFEGVAVARAGSTPGVDGISGRVQASEDSGTIEFQTEAFVLDWPALFGGSVDGESLTGAVVWRQGRDAVQILSVDLGVGILDREARASFDLKLPRDGSSPTVDIEAELASVDLVAAKQYLPRPVMPDVVVAWLDDAVVGGVAHDIELTLFGPLARFPFDAGGGQFRVAADVEGVTLNYMNDWPQADDVDGWIEFVNAGFFAGASGQTLGNRTENFELALPDMRDPTLTMSADTNGGLGDVVAYLRAAPLIAERLGPGFERLEVQAGSGALRARLDLPLQDLAAFGLDAALTIGDGALTFRGLGPAITEINGVMTAEEDRVSAEDVRGIFLGGPISAALTRSEQAGYRAELVIDGETSIGSVSDAFGMPQTDLIVGQALWRGRLLLPALDPLATTPTTFTVESNLSGVALRLPQPLAKPPSEPVNLAVDLNFLADNRVEVNGNLGATRRFVLALTVDGDNLRFARGAVEFGGGEPRLPVDEGILVGGQIGTLELDRWLAMGSTAGVGRAEPLFLGADVDIASLHAFGQQLGTTSLRVVRNRDDWAIDVDSEAIAGEIVVPRGAGGRQPIVADMRRIYLAAAGESGLSEIDPRALPGLQLQAAEFGFGNRQLGTVSAIVEPVAEGVVLTEFTSRTPNFETDMSGSWLGEPSRSRTTLNAEITSTDVAAALAELGLDPAVDGESAAVTASVYWEAGPTAAWLDHLNGEVGLTVETGTLREVDPGAGRVVGLMSIAALPRRLLLDFRDVFEEGFAFDEITGNFTVIDGNAYTNDLKFGGPAAEIGVVGRTGLRDRDYRQQVVVTAEPGNMLPTVGGLLGGAGVGAALLIFTRLFKEQLKGIGRASYCLSGNWESPTVEPIDDEEPAAAELCAELPEEMRPVVTDE
jgi:uncharacterized protein (TIGR02099 family)